MRRLLHADHQTRVEHGALHKPVHISTTFGYSTAAGLVAVFQGVNPGFVCARQGNPTGGSLRVRRVRRWEHEAVVEVMQRRLDRMPEAMTLRRSGDAVAWRVIVINAASVGMPMIRGADDSTVGAAGSGWRGWSWVLHQTGAGAQGATLMIAALRPDPAAPR